MKLNDTICAIATAPGGALGIVRVTGLDCLTLVDAAFIPRKGGPISERKGYSLALGQIKREDGSLIDEVVVSIFRNPHSYTGEDSVEISCHGSSYILREVLSRLIELGARMARPGEFTERAFLNGKMDLSQAEAVADLIASNSRASQQVAMNQVRGGFSKELAHLRQQLLHFASMMELELDFSDHEDLEFADRGELVDLSCQIEHVIDRLVQSYRAGNAIKNGVPVVIVGETNAGKSTLLNALLGEEKAIVSNVHGTTRDVIEDTIDIEGIVFRFIDTAGLRQTDDEIESLGISRTYTKIQQAAIILWMIDATDTSTAERLRPDVLNRAGGKSLIILFNKCDCINHKQESKAIDSFKDISVPQLFISARDRTHLSDLRSTLIKAAALPDWTQNEVIVTNVRHYEALIKALASIRRVKAGLENGLSGDLISQDIRECIYHLSDIAGEVTSENILQNIFQNFCVGK